MPYFFTLLTAIELIIITYVTVDECVYDINLVNINTVIHVYLIVFIIIDMVYIYICTGTFLLYPKKFNYKILIYFMFLLISYISSFTISRYFKDLFYFLARYIFLFMRASKCEQIFNSKALQYKYKIHSLLFCVFIITQSIQNINDIIFFDNILICLLLLVNKYTVDVIIIFRILNQSFHKPQTIMNVDHIEHENELKNKRNNGLQKIRQRFGPNNKTKIIKKFKTNPNQSESRSSAKSVKLINQKTGNDNIKRLRSFDKKTYKMEQNKLPPQNEDECSSEQKMNELAQHKKMRFVRENRLKSNRQIYEIIPPKPRNIDEFVSQDTKKLYKEFLECFGETRSHYIGTCNDDGIEIEFVSNDNAVLKGKRIINFNRMKKIEGNGIIFIDLLWDKLHKRYVDCVFFEYIDEYNGIETKLQFNSFVNKIDCDHLYFEGEYCINNTNIGQFKIVCVSIRRRDIINKRKTFLEYHTNNSVIPMPQYIKCINVSAHKLNILYNTQNNNVENKSWRQHA